MGAGPPFADGGICRLFSFGDQPDHTRSGCGFGKGLDDVRQKLQE